MKWSKQYIYLKFMANWLESLLGILDKTSSYWRYYGFEFQVMTTGICIHVNRPSWHASGKFNWYSCPEKYHEITSGVHHNCLPNCQCKLALLCAQIAIKILLTDTSVATVLHEKFGRSVACWYDRNQITHKMLRGRTRCGKCQLVPRISSTLLKCILIHELPKCPA